MDRTSNGMATAANSAETSIDIVLNGAPHVVPPACTLDRLIDALALSGQPLALAVNRSVVPRQKWPEHALQPRDHVDIVRAIGGG
jgi:sulfur carrier protein